MHGEVEPVTVTVARRVAPGREPEFEDWAESVLRVASTYDGFLGGGVLRPGVCGHEWHIVYRFAGEPDLRRWEGSAERAAWLRKAENLLDETRVHRISGLETWFELPGRTAPAPPRWKMALVSLVAIFPLALLFNAFVLPRLSSWPLPLRVATLSVSLVVLMTWVALPQLSRLFTRWLYPRR